MKNRGASLGIKDCTLKFLPLRGNKSPAPPVTAASSWVSNQMLRNEKTPPVSALCALSSPAIPLAGGCPAGGREGAFLWVFASQKPKLKIRRDADFQKAEAAPGGAASARARDRSGILLPGPPGKRI
jgi:hypothetical protein